MVKRIFTVIVLTIATSIVSADQLIGNFNPINRKTLQSKDFRRYTAFGEFNEIKAFLSSAIEERGIKISNISHVSDMLQRTGKDLGRTEVIYKHAEAIEFCSATLSREMMLANPHNIIFCPFIVYIYELEKDPGTTYLSYRLPFYFMEDTNHPALQKVDDLLRGIVEEVVE